MNNTELEVEESKMLEVFFLCDSVSNNKNFFGSSFSSDGWTKTGNNDVDRQKQTHVKLLVLFGLVTQTKKQTNCGYG